MKVLQEGRDQKGWANEFTCSGNGGCGALLLVEEGDLMCWTRGDYGGGSEEYCSFTCLWCGQENTMPAAYVPARVVNAVINKAFGSREKNTP